MNLFKFFKLNFREKQSQTLVYLLKLEFKRIFDEHMIPRFKKRSV